MLRLFKLFCDDESGVTPIEYGFIAAFVSVAVIGAREETACDGLRVGMLWPSVFGARTRRRDR